MNEFMFSKRTSAYVLVVIRPLFTDQHDTENDRRWLHTFSFRAM